MRLIPLAVILLVQVWGNCAAGAGDTPAWIAPDDPGFRYDGAWQPATSNTRCVRVGGTVRFRCAGAAQLLLNVPAPASARIRVSVDEQLHFDGRCAGPLEFQAANTGSVVEVAVVATQGPWKEVPPLLQGVEWRGLRVAAGQQLHLLPAPRMACPLIWVGDSIMNGVAIRGRDGDELANSDALLAFPALVAHRLDARSRLIARSGASVRELALIWQQSWPTLALPTNRSPVVVVNAGANDTRQSIPIFQAQLQELIGVIRHSCPDATIVLLDFHRRQPDRTDTLQRLVAADQTHRTFFLDAHRHLTGYADRGVHPDHASHAALAADLADWLMTHCAAP